MNRRLTLSILSVSLLTIMASAAISPALAKIAQAFPGADKTLIKLILTMPSLLITPFALLSGWLAIRVSKKSILFWGLAIYCVAGVGGGFARTIPQLLVIRAILGIGIGLIMPLSTTLIADFFEGEARTKMMGLSGAVNNIGGVAFLSVSGWLACISWRLSFGVYALSLVTMVMTFLWLPEPRAQASAGPARLNGSVFRCSLYGLLMMIAFYALPTNLALFIESQRTLFYSQKPLFKNAEDLRQHLETGTVSDITLAAFRDSGITLKEPVLLSAEEPGKKWKIRDAAREYLVQKEDKRLVILAERLGRPAIAGYALSVMTLGGVLSGLLLPLLSRRMGRLAYPFCIALMGLGFYILGRSTSLWMVFASVPLIGFSSGVLVPALFLTVQKTVEPQSRALGMAVVGGGIFLGQFLSPLALKVTALFPGRDPGVTTFMTVAAGLFAAAIVGLFMSKPKGGPAVAAGPAVNGGKA
ncbi:MAG: MFS transporter [Elusimicrobia bacterium]|nr:MFS transporter [Elusimicrobiota bacterium]